MLNLNPRLTRFDSHRGFSLIELLVVIAIIAVLIGILLPTLPAIRDSARRAACGSNLRGVGQAVEMYKGDFREAFPVARYMPPPWLSGDNDPPLNTALKGYIEIDNPAYRCPGDRIVHGYEWIDEDDGDRRKTTGMSYTYVVNLSGQPYEQTFFFTFLQLGPTDTPVAYDFDGGTFETQAGDLVQVDFFHSTRNVLFADGGVRQYGE